MMKQSIGRKVLAVLTAIWLLMTAVPAAAGMEDTAPVQLNVQWTDAEGNVIQAFPTPVTDDLTGLTPYAPEQIKGAWWVMVPADQLWNLTLIISSSPELNDSFFPASGTLLTEVADAGENLAGPSLAVTAFNPETQVQDIYLLYISTVTEIPMPIEITPEPTEEPTPEPTEEPTPEPTEEPTPEPTEEPTPEPTEEPTPEPTEEPTPEPTEEPTPEPTEEPTPEPTEEPTPEPTEEPTPEPTEEPTPEPTEEPTPEPTEEPTPEPTEEPTPEPTEEPTPEPTEELTPEPTEEPTPEPTEEPTPEPTEEPTPEPTEEPTPEPTEEPTPEPTEEPTPEPPVETPIPMGDMINRFAQTNKNVRFRAEMSTASTIKKELKSGDYVYALRDQFNELGERWTAVLYWNEFGYVMSEYLDVLSQADSDIIQHADPSQSPVPAMSAEELDARMYPNPVPQETEVPAYEETEQPIVPVPAPEGNSAAETLTPETVETEAPAETPIPQGEMINRFARTTSSVRMRAAKSTKSSILKNMKAHEAVYVLREELDDAGTTSWMAVLTKGDKTGYVMAEYLEVLSQAESDAVMATMGTPIPPRTKEELDGPQGAETPEENTLQKRSMKSGTPETDFAGMEEADPFLDALVQDILNGNIREEELEAILKNYYESEENPEEKVQSATTYILEKVSAEATPAPQQEDPPAPTEDPTVYYDELADAVLAGAIGDEDVEARLRGRFEGAENSEELIRSGLSYILERLEAEATPEPTPTENPIVFYDLMADAVLAGDIGDEDVETLLGSHFEGAVNSEELVQNGLSYIRERVEAEATPTPKPTENPIVFYDELADAVLAGDIGDEDVEALLRSRFEGTVNSEELVQNGLSYIRERVEAEATPTPRPTENPNVYYDELADAVLAGDIGDEDVEAQLRNHFEGTANSEELVQNGLYYILERVETEATPTPKPTDTPAPTATSTAEPTATPTATPTSEPTATPTATPTAEPTATPTTEPTVTPTTEPTATPTAEPTSAPTAEPTAAPTSEPKSTPTAEPTNLPATEPSAFPTADSTAVLTAEPVVSPEPPQIAGYAITIGDGAYVRNWPNSNSVIIDELPANQIVFVNGQTYAEDYAWHQVQYNNTWGYIRADTLRMMGQSEVNAYLDERNATPEPTVQITVQPYDKDSLSSYGYTSTTVNFREKASQSSNRIRQLKKYAFCLVLGTTEVNGEKWYRVMFDGKTGYIKGDFFKQLTLAEMESFLASQDYLNGLANNASSSNSNAGSTGRSGKQGSSDPAQVVSAEDQKVEKWKNPDSGIQVSYEPFDPFATPEPLATEEPNEYLDSLVKDVQNGTVSDEQLETLLRAHYQGTENQDELVQAGLAYIREKLQAEATPTPEPSPEATEETATVLPPQEENEGPGGGIWIIGAAIAIAAGGAGYALYTSNRRKQKERAAAAKKRAAQNRMPVPDSWAKTGSAANSSAYRRPAAPGRDSGVQSSPGSSATSGTGYFGTSDRSSGAGYSGMSAGNGGSAYSGTSEGGAGAGASGMSTGSSTASRSRTGNYTNQNGRAEISPTESAYSKPRTATGNPYARRTSLPDEDEEASYSASYRPEEGRDSEQGTPRRRRTRP